MIVLISIILLAGASIWYMNNTAYEKRAESRIHKYMDAQGIHENQITTEISQKDIESGDWKIMYELKGEENIAYEYAYDRHIDAVLLIVYGPNEKEADENNEIKEGMNYPPLADDWVTFDDEGKIQIP